MKLEKFLNAAQELTIRSMPPGSAVEFKIVSGSMRPLIAENDYACVRKLCPAELRQGDIIVWRSSLTEKYFAHRITGTTQTGRGIAFTTQGDGNPYPDIEPVACDTIIGKVIRVKKVFPPVTISLETPAGRFCSACSHLMGRANIRFVGIRKKIRAFCGNAYALLETRCNTRPTGNYLLNYGMINDTYGWQARVAAAVNLLPDALARTSRATADVQPGGGFSEEAMALSRNGVPVTPIPLLGDRPANAFDIVLAADILSLLPAGKARAIIYQSLKACLATGGILLVSGSGHANPEDERFSVKMRTILTILSTQTSCYYDPFTKHFIANGRIAQYALPLCQAMHELRQAGFIIARTAAQGSSWAILAAADKQ